MAIHTVKSGDTLWSISVQYHTTVDKLKEVNGLTSNLIVPGLALYIPELGAPTRYYYIRPGDTFWALSQRFQTSIQAIMQANPTLNPYQLQIGQRINIPSPLKYELQTLAFVDAYLPFPYEEMLQKYASQITYLAIFSYSVTPDGHLITIPDEEIIETSKKYNIKPLMVIGNIANGTFDVELVDNVLEPRNRATLLSEIKRVVVEKGYAGVSIDFEFMPAERRNDFTLFLYELKKALGSLLLHVNVFSKSAENTTNPFSGAFDYREIGNIVDMMAIMTIDYGYTIGPPDPIAPLWWLESIFMYATGQVNRRKIMMSIPLYGYDWKTPIIKGVDAKAGSNLYLQNQAINKLSPISYDQRAEAPTYPYKNDAQSHEVWFEDIRSIEAKYRLLEVYRLLGTTFWRLRYAFPQNWAYLNKNYHVKK